MQSFHNGVCSVFPDVLRDEMQLRFCEIPDDVVEDFVIEMYERDLIYKDYLGNAYFDDRFVKNLILEYQFNAKNFKTNFGDDNERLIRFIAYL